MNFFKYLAVGLVASSAVAGFTACSDDFLDETLPAQYDTSYFQTAEGIQALTKTLYGTFCTSAALYFFFNFPEKYTVFIVYLFRICVIID